MLDETGHQKPTVLIAWVSICSSKWLHKWAADTGLHYTAAWVYDTIYDFVLFTDQLIDISIYLQRDRQSYLYHVNFV